MSNYEVYEVVWPRGKRVADVIPYAKRLNTLKGKTIVELCNWIFRADEIFPLINRELEKRYPGIRFEMFDLPHGGDEAKVMADLPNVLKQSKCDAVIAGVGS